MVKIQPGETTVDKKGKLSGPSLVGEMQTVCCGWAATPHLLFFLDSRRALLFGDIHHSVSDMSLILSSFNYVILLTDIICQNPRYVMYQYILNI